MRVCAVGKPHEKLHVAIFWRILSSRLGWQIVLFDIN
jgi:hypothetical protein